MITLNFRVWDKVEKQMHYLKGPHDAFYFDQNGARYVNLQNGGGGNEYAIMQHTGMDDKNGNEIYEGDLFKIGVEPNIYEVGFKYGCFMGFKGDESIGLLGELEYCFIDVIGNIHENPELL